MQIRVRLVCGVAFGLSRLLRLDLRLFCFFVDDSSGARFVSNYRFFLGLNISVKAFSWTLILEFLLVYFLFDFGLRCLARDERDLEKVRNNFEWPYFYISRSFEIRKVLSVRGGSADTSEKDVSVLP